MENMNPDQFKSRMHSLAYGNAMMAAAKDYMKEMAEDENASTSGNHQQLAVDDFADDPELERLYAERLAAMQKEAEKRVVLERKGHGSLQEVQEADFLDIATNTENLVCHFFHRDFERCKILDKHLEVLAKKYFNTRFIKISAPDAPFFTVKLQVKVLPCVIMLQHGLAVDRAVGFDDYGQKDDFDTVSVERRLLKAGVIHAPKQPEDDSEWEPELVRRSVMRSVPRTNSDEDSDFE